MWAKVDGRAVCDGRFMGGGTPRDVVDRRAGNMVADRQVAVGVPFRGR